MLLIYSIHTHNNYNSTKNNNISDKHWEYSNHVSRSYIPLHSSQVSYFIRVPVIGKLKEPL